MTDFSFRTIQQARNITAMTINSENHQKDAPYAYGPNRFKNTGQQSEGDGHYHTSQRNIAREDDNQYANRYRNDAPHRITKDEYCGTAGYTFAALEGEEYWPIMTENHAKPRDHSAILTGKPFADYNGKNCLDTVSDIRDNAVTPAIETRKSSRTPLR